MVTLATQIIFRSIKQAIGRNRHLSEDRTATFSRLTYSSLSTLPSDEQLPTKFHL